MREAASCSGHAWHRLAVCSTKFAAPRRDAMRTAALLLAAALGGTQQPARALPDECMNGMMEERQRNGLDPFAPPCSDPDPWARSLPPVYPIFVAQRAVDSLLTEESTFRNSVRLSLPVGRLQLPPEINPSLLERIADQSQSADTMRAAAKSYVRNAYDANELVGFAIRGRSEQTASDAEVCELVDRALAACQECKVALATIVALLPQDAVEMQGMPSTSTRVVQAPRRLQD